MASETPACPICGHTEWDEDREPYALRQADPRILQGGGVVVTAYFCARCDYIRLHRKR